VAETKGISFVNAQAFCGEIGGSDGWSRVLGSMSAADREVLQSVLAVGWYDLWLYARLIRAIDATLGSGNFELIKTLGRFEAERDITTVYRLFFRLANPGYAIEKTMAYWRRFHDTGVWEVSRISDTAVHGTLSDWGVVDMALCLELTGYMPRVIELVGGKNAVMVHPRCRSRGADVCSFELSWQK
jgi:predicted hydrocarbon binding protein